MFLLFILFSVFMKYDGVSTKKMEYNSAQKSVYQHFFSPCTQGKNLERLLTPDTWHFGHRREYAFFPLVDIGAIFILNGTFVFDDQISFSYDISCHNHTVG